ncbi:MAG: cyclic nucleotide-binding domain-containing protein [Desulfobacterales bacterium]
MIGRLSDGSHHGGHLRGLSYRDGFDLRRGENPCVVLPIKKISHSQKDSTMPVEIQTIEPLAFFQGLSYIELEQFASLLKPRSVKKGEVLLRQGTPAMTFFIILSGTFTVSLEKGRAYTLDKKGTVIGWSTVIAPFEYTGTAMAETDGEVLSISSNDFFQLIQNNNALGKKIIAKIDKIASERRALNSKEKS